jgi:hypothetical protein
MRVTVVAPAGEGFIGPSLASGFVACGHTVTLLGEQHLTAGHGVYIRARRVHVAAPLIEAAGRRLALRVVATAPDIIIIVKGRFVAASAVRRMRGETGAVVASWCPDDPLYPAYRDSRWLRSLRECDTVAIWSEGLACRLRELGIRAVAIPFGYDPRWYSAEPRSVPRWDVMFVGQWSPEREAHIRALSGLSVGVAGLGWAKALRRTSLRRAVVPGRHFGRGVAALYRASLVGINVLHPQNHGTHNMRSWELPATRTAMVATDSQEHRAIFGTTGAVLVRGPTSLRAAVDDLLGDATRREVLAESGHAAVVDGTYAGRVAAFLAKVRSTSL